MKYGTRIFLALLAVLAIVLVVAARGSHDSSMLEASDTNQQVAQTVDVTTIVHDGSAETSYDQSVATGSSALDVLLKLGETQGLDIQTTAYDFGTIVDSIDGVGVDTSDNKYWIYYINGETATEGASAYLVQNGDTILWNYEDSM